jgi:hypothetical protein
MRGRQRAAVGAAVGLWVVVALHGPARAGAAAAGASEMIDDVVSTADQRVLAHLADALAAEAGGARRAVEGLARRHADVVWRWLLSADARVARGYQRGALLDLLITSRDRGVRALASGALLARPGLGYCMRALPSADGMARGPLASLVRDLGVVESLRRQAAVLMLADGAPGDAARARAGAVARAERIAVQRMDLARRWLLDETDAGIFDGYRAEIVRAFLGSAIAPLRDLAGEVVERRGRLAAGGGALAGAS